MQIITMLDLIEVFATRSISITTSAKAKNKGLEDTRQ
jgi:hypothetical protein